jgi:hypothetical protein
MEEGRRALPSALDEPAMADEDRDCMTVEDVESLQQQEQGTCDDLSSSGLQRNSTSRSGNQLAEMALEVAGEHPGEATRSMMNAPACNQASPDVAGETNQDAEIAAKIALSNGPRSPPSVTCATSSTSRSDNVIDKTSYNGRNETDQCDRLRAVAMVLGEQPPPCPAAATASSNIKESLKTLYSDHRVGAFAKGGVCEDTITSTSQDTTLQEQNSSLAAGESADQVAIDVDMEQPHPGGLHENLYHKAQEETTLVEATLVTDHEGTDHNPAEPPRDSILVEARPVVKRRRTSILILGALLLVAGGIVATYVLTRATSEDDSSPSAVTPTTSIYGKPTLEHILEEGVLRCGVMTESAGSFFQIENGVENLMEADLVSSKKARLIILF